jgi:putative aldouronate transport system substrate-binding protein
MTIASRRTFLRGALGAGAVAAGGPLRAACGGTAATHAGGSGSAKVTLPSYLPYQGVTPDLPATKDGVLPAFLNYPANPKRVSSSAPGTGGSVSAFVQTYSPVPPPLGKNPFWQQVDRRLGVKLDMVITPTADYPSKLATLVAGNDLPDLVQIAGAVPQLPALLAAKFEDLTPYLSGDNVKDYPFLANIPTESWKTAVYGGGIYGIPVPRGVIGRPLFVRNDLLAAKGLSTEGVTTFADLRKLFVEINDPAHHRWALGSASTMVAIVQQMLGVPNTWGIDSSGKFTSFYEVPETKQALSVCAQLVKDGLVQPDGFSSSANPTQWFEAGQVVFTDNGYTAFSQLYRENVAGKKYDVIGLVPMKFDAGSTPSRWQNGAALSFTAFKKGDDKRVKELLAIANWLAAPFGTEEFQFRKYGIAGRDYTLQDGNPVLSQTGTTETGLNISYIADAPAVLYEPGLPDVTKKEYAFAKAFVPGSLPNPALEYYSETNSSKGSLLWTNITDAQNQILQGRQPLSSWDDAVKAWLDGGGNQIRQELEEAYQKR